MSRGEVTAALPGVLARTNPEGRALPRDWRAPESPAWNEAIEVALSREAPQSTRLAAAVEATRIAAAMRPVDHRLGVSLLTAGRLKLRRDPAAAAEDFSQAYRLFVDRFGAEDIRTAQAGVHLAALAVRTGQFELAIELADRHLPTARAGQNAILVAGLLSIKSEAQLRPGRRRGGAGDAARLPALGALWLRRCRRGARPGAGADRRPDRPRQPVRTDAVAARLRPRGALRMAAGGRARR